MKLKKENGKEYIYDVVRQKYILNQPEEWVRQNIIKYLNEQKGYPTSLMKIEKKVVVNNLPKRCDIVCYNNNGRPVLLVECKSPKIRLDRSCINQSINYQKEINAKYILITNGLTHYCFQLVKNKVSFLKQIPPYKRNNN